MATHQTLVKEVYPQAECKRPSWSKWYIVSDGTKEISKSKTERIAWKLALKKIKTPNI